MDICHRLVVHAVSHVQRSRSVHDHCTTGTAVSMCCIPSPAAQLLPQVPKKVLLWLINWMVPDLLKDSLVNAIPPEIGEMLLHTRQSVTVDTAVRPSHFAVSVDTALSSVLCYRVGVALE